MNHRLFVLYFSATHGDYGLRKINKTMDDILLMCIENNFSAV